MLSNGEKILAYPRSTPRPQLQPSKSFESEENAAKSDCKDTRVASSIPSPAQTSPFKLRLALSIAGNYSEQILGGIPHGTPHTF
jgi:hypothetical protein